jgi:mannosyltransferase
MNRRGGGRAAGTWPAGGWAASILILAAAVRFWRLDLFSLGFDEAMSLRRAMEPTLAAVWRATFVEVPVYNALLHGWLGLGRSPAVARALSSALSVAALGVGWFMLRRLLAPAPALAALALFAFSPFQVQYAQEARPYMLMLLAEFAAVLGLFRAADRGRTADWGVWAAGCAVAALSHLVALAWIAASAVFVWLIGAGASRRRDLARVAGWGALAAAPALIFAATDARSIARVNETAPQAFGVPDFLLGIDNFFGPGAWVPAPLVVPSLAVFGFLMLTGLFLCATPARPDPAARRLRAAVLAFGLVPPLLVLLGSWAGIVYRPKPRYAMGAQLFLLAACARVLWVPPWPAVRALGLGALLALDAASLAKYFGGGFPTLDLPPCKKPFHAVAADLVARARPGDGVLSCVFETYLPLDYHLGGRLPHGYVLRDPFFSEGELHMLGFPVDLERFVRAHRRVWLVTAPVFYTAPVDVPGDVVARLRRVAVPREDETRPGIRITRWEALP